MTPVIQALLTIAAVLVAAAFLWRGLSRRASLPCPAWLACLVEAENPLAPGQSSKWIVERLAIQPGMKVLDAGCGPGRVTVPLARAVGPDGEVMALDLQPGMLARAEAKARACGLQNIRYLNAPLGAGKLGDLLFDRVTLVTVLGEIPDRQAALRELFAALKPGGILSITELIFDPHFQRESTVLKLAIPLGFRRKAFFGQRFAYTLHLEK